MKNYKKIIHAVTKEKTQQNLGITLIALVVTIIVLLILTGVSLSLMTGGNGILNKAAKAVDQTQLAAFNEAKELADAEMMMNMYLSETQYNSLYDYIKAKCQENEDNVLKTEIEKVMEDLKKEHEASGSDKTLQEYLQDKCDQNGGSISTSTGGTIASNGDGTFTYADATENPSTGDFKVDDSGKITVTNTEINKSESTGGSGGSGEATLPSKDLATGDITFEYSTKNWTNSAVTITAKPNIDTTGYTLQTSRNGVTWSNQASQTFTANGTFYVRLYNGAKYGAAATANVDKIDTKKPVITTAIGTTFCQKKIFFKNLHKKYDL